MNAAYASNAPRRVSGSELGLDSSLALGWIWPRFLSVREREPESGVLALEEHALLELAELLGLAVEPRAERPREEEKD